jgi:transcriptional regulator with XRE-family HTH domain
LETRASRLRAARAYAKRSQLEIAEFLGVHPQSVKRWENARAPISDERLYAVADFCDVPRRFMDDGFAIDNADRELAEVRAERDALRAEFTATLDRVREAADLGRQVAERMAGTTSTESTSEADMDREAR